MNHHHQSFGILALGSLLSVAGLVACEDGGHPSLKPQPVIETELTDFGKVRVGRTKELLVLIENRGSALLKIKSITPGAGFDIDAFAFSLDRDSVVPNGSGQLKLRFTPQHAGPLESELFVLFNDDASPVSLVLQGDGVNTGLVLDVEDIDCGDVVVGATKTVSLQLRNEADHDEEIFIGAASTAEACGSGSPQIFCVRVVGMPPTSEGVFNIGGGQSLTLEIVFAPAVAGAVERGNLTLVACNGIDCQTRLNLQGRSVYTGLHCQPAEVDFANVAPGTCKSLPVSCDNVAHGTLQVQQWTPTPNTSSEFQVQASTPTSLNQGQSLVIDTAYCPTGLGRDLGAIELEITEAGHNVSRTVAVPLSGSGGGPSIEVSPQTINFGLVSLLAPARRPFTIRNLGFEDLAVAEILNLGGPFAVINGNGLLSIPPGRSITVDVQFSPAAALPYEGELLIRSNDVASPELRIRLLGEGIDLPPCDYEIQPALSFGGAQVNRTSRLGFEIANIGADDCLVTGAQIEPGSDSVFSLVDDDINSVIIDPGASFAVLIDYTPDAQGLFTGWVTFSVSSSSAPVGRVALSAGAAPSALVIVPRDIDFGTLAAGCSAAPRTLQLYNPSSVPATIDSITRANGSNTGFSIVSLPAPLPIASLSIAPGGSVEFTVGFGADRHSDYTGAVEIIASFNGQPATYVVGLLGKGSVDVARIDRFTGPSRSKADILFVVDNSASMGQEQAAMASNFTSFIQSAQAQAIDYQIAVTTTDVSPTGERGRIVPLNDPSRRIVTSASLPSPAAVFASNVAVGVNGSTIEQGLEAALLAFTSSAAQQHNQGFLRSDAALSVIFVSDEPDFSPRSVDFYVNALLSIKGFRNADLFSASAIVGDVPGGCNGQGGNAAAAPRYVQTAQRTGGVIQSICTSDWPRAFEALSQSTFALSSRFFLSDQPVVRTLQVSVDGNPVPATAAGGTVNWTYDTASNAVRFSPFAAPEPGLEVIIRYDVTVCM